MPFSTKFFKKEIIDYIVENFSKDIKILDIGPGIGTYSDILSNIGYSKIDCIEAFEKYVYNYRLKNKYRNVIVGDVCETQIDFSEYDLIILGDVLEHIEVSKAVDLLNNIGSVPCIIAVPFLSPQDIHFDNKYEIHLQDNLTPRIFTEIYKGFVPLCLRWDYGVFVRESNGTLFLETEHVPLPEDYKLYIKEYFPQLIIKNIKLESKEMQNSETKTQSKTTIVTCLLNLGRDKISDSFRRNYGDYLKKFGELLKSDCSMYIFADKSDEEFIWSIRKKENTVINFMSLTELKDWFEFTNLTNEIRKKESWVSQSGWLKDSPQATLEGYNPLVMSKMFMLNNVTIWNPFQSEYFFWIDAGITSTVHYGYFTHDKVFDNLEIAMRKLKDFIFLTYPYIGGEEIHGFKRQEIARYCNTDYVKYVCRGGFFGGKKDAINQINGLYYSYLSSSLREGLMGTEESIFTILMHNHSEIISQYMIEENGLIWPFFEELKDKSLSKGVINLVSDKLDTTKVGLYVISYNSPKQFETLIKSFIEYDSNFLDKPIKFLLDNSSDLSTYQDYVNLCKKYDFVHIKKDNLGICGGRQFIAEHFQHETNLDYYLFFEDDMFFYGGEEYCKNGFNRKIKNLYNISLEIINKENFDFLKLNFSEFFGDNGTQWSWYNVPQNIREEFWPEKPTLPVMGTDPNAPKTTFKNILSHKGVPYSNGEVYYSNWPQIVSRTGNKKMFLDTTWAHPFEQTWMSHMYQLTKKGELNPSILLLTPTEHNRFEHYDRNLRKES